MPNRATSAKRWKKIFGGEGKQSKGEALRNLGLHVNNLLIRVDGVGYLHHILDNGVLSVGELGRKEQARAAMIVQKVSE